MQTYLGGKRTSRPAVTSVRALFGQVSRHRLGASLDNAGMRGYVPYRLIGLQNVKTEPGRSDDGRRDLEAENA
jgi:hypothetical protein